MSPLRITGARITPVAFRDPPLLNTVGVHQPYALRAIIQLDTDAGLVGLGETYADTRHLARLRAAADAITGLDVFALNMIRAAIADTLRGDTAAVGTAGMITSASASIAAISSSGANTPPLSLIAVKPYSATMRRAWATMPSGSSAAPNASGSAPGWAAHL